MPDRPQESIPARSAVFPLPDSVLFPNTLLPLHVFEPQYRLMLDDCLSRGGLITVVLLRKGSPKSLLDAPAYTVGGLGRVTTAMRLPDATSRIFLGGVARVAILRYTQRRPYPVAEIEPLSPAPVEPGLMDAARRRALSLFQMLIGEANGAARDFLARVEGLRDPGATADLISAGLDADPHVKQRLLETVDLPERYERLTRILEEQVREARAIRELLARAPRNVQDN